VRGVVYPSSGPHVAGGTALARECGRALRCSTAGSGSGVGLAVPFGLPSPGQQAVELMGFDVTADDPLEHVLQVFERVETAHPGTLDQRGEDGPGARPGIRAGEQAIAAPRGNGLSILPTSGRMLTSTTAGTLCMVAVSGCKAANRAAMAVSILSSQRPATSRYCRNGCWTRSSVRAWQWERLGSRWQRSSTFSVS
jgi:hypothetical protein